MVESLKVARDHPILQLVESHNAEEWDNYLAHTTGGTAFHRFRWLQLQALVHGWRFVPLVARVSGNLVGIVPLLLTRRGPVLMRAPVPFPYVGPIVDPDHLEAALAALSRWVGRHKVAFTRMEFVAPTFELTTALRNAGWSCQDEQTLVLDISHGSADAFWRGADRGVRASLRKAEKRGVVVRPATREQAATWLPVLLQEAYGARGLDSPYPKELFGKVWDAYADEAFVHAALVGDEPGGLCVALGHGDTLYGWVGGGFRARRDDQPTTALYVHHVLWALERGYRKIDLVGSVDEGVSRFKRSFGAQTQRYVVAQRAHSHFWGFARAFVRHVQSTL